MKRLLYILQALAWFAFALHVQGAISWGISFVEWSIVRWILYIIGFFLGFMALYLLLIWWMGGEDKINTAALGAWGLMHVPLYLFLGYFGEYRRYAGAEVQTMHTYQAAHSHAEFMRLPDARIDLQKLQKMRYTYRPKSTKNNRNPSPRTVIYQIAPLYAQHDSAQVLAYVCSNSEDWENPIFDAKQTFMRPQTGQFTDIYPIYADSLRRYFALRDLGERTPLLELVNLEAETKIYRDFVLNFYIAIWVLLIVFSLIPPEKEI